MQKAAFSEWGIVKAPQHGVVCSHFRADGEEPYGFASVIGRLRYPATGGIIRVVPRKTFAPMWWRGFLFFLVPGKQK